jgi:hypothetical protein
MVIICCRWGWRSATVIVQKMVHIVQICVLHMCTQTIEHKGSNGP